MPATSKHRPLEDALVAAFVDDLRRRTADLSEYFFDRHRRIARHFLIWIDLAGVELKKVDATIVHRFLRHDCRCGASCAPVRIQRWRKRRRSAELMRFVRFLERSGHVETPGELEDNLRLLDAFLGGLRDGGYAAGTINAYRYACTALIVWLHLSRIRPGERLELSHGFPYQILSPRRPAPGGLLVPGERLELSHGLPYQILSLARLPVSPPRQDQGRRERTEGSGALCVNRSTSQACNGGVLA